MTSLAVVGRVTAITPHPGVDREGQPVHSLEVIQIDTGHETTELVTGKHYREGDLGVWLKAGAFLPGWLSRQMWVIGKKRAMSEWFDVRDKPLFGVQSPGLWAGHYYQTDRTEPSIERAVDMLRRRGIEHPTDEQVAGWIEWPWWEARWQVGDDVSNWLGVVPFNPTTIDWNPTRYEPTVPNA